MGAVIYLLVMNQLNDLPVDAGDGIQHFSTASESWEDHRLFLDHWGKPLFTLLSSPFAQLGFSWYICFNILVFAFTCLVVFRIFSYLNVSTAYYFFFPLLLLVIPDYTYCVLGGMTEPLFGLMIVLMLLCGFRQHWYWFALIGSFTLFSRSEGMLVVILALIVLAANRRWKAIPLLGVGFLVYAIAGWYQIGLFWWYFEKDPYAEAIRYGAGTWHHYLDFRTAHTGILTMLLIPFGAFGLFVFVKRNTIPRSVYLVLFGIGIYIGVLLVHSYLWAYGLRGSIGLSRIATLGVPGLLTLLLVGCHCVTRELHMLPKALAALLLSLGIVKEVGELEYPLKANPLEEIVMEAAVYVQKHYPGAKICYFHPLIAWKMGYSTKDLDSGIEQRYFKAQPFWVTDLPEGTIIIRDPAFGPLEQGLPMDFVRQFPEMVEVKKITTDKPYRIYNDEPVEVHIYKIVKQ